MRSADGRLIGFVGVYRHGAEPELTGMIDPDHRRRGLAGQALDQALTLVTDASTLLLVVARSSVGGRRLAESRGAVLDHSEHALVQRAAPPAVDWPPGLVIRPALEPDRDVVARLVQAGFGHPGGSGDRLGGTMMADLDGRPIGTLAMERTDDQTGIYGFVVDPELQGRGLGRAILARVCRQVRADGVREVRLEVEVRNERALGLYTSLGFEPVTTEDYYRLTINS